MRQLKSFAAILLSLIVTTGTQATISLPTIAPVPTPAGMLDNFVSQDLVVNTTADWTTAALVLELSQGSIYQDTFGDDVNSPPTLIVAAFPSAAFDTYVGDPHDGAAINGAAGDLGSLLQQFDQTRLNVSWNSAGSDFSDIGNNNIARITLSDDAQGTWSLAVTEAFNPIVKFLSNPIVNGQMTSNPLQGDLNFDGFVGIEDLNKVLGAWNQSPTPGDRAAGDPSGDGFVGIEDLNITLGNWNTGLIPLVPGSNSTVLRDYNQDGFVGLDDQNILNSNWNLTVTPGDISRGDGSGDGFVGIEDKVNGNWGAGTPPMPAGGGAPPAVVPEPMSISLMGFGLAALIQRRA